MVIDYQQFIQILKPVIDYTSLVIDYQRRFSENNFQESHLFKRFMNGHQRSIYMWLGNTNLKRVFIVQKILSSQKIKSFSKLKCLYPLKKIPWSTTCIFNKEFWLIFIVQSISFKRDFFFSSSYFWKWIKRPWVSCCRGFLNTREGLSLCGSDFVKGVLQREWKISSGLLEDWT